jgi:DNA-binding CsgD family transcriptional regulator
MMNTLIKQETHVDELFQHTNLKTASVKSASKSARSYIQPIQSQQSDIAHSPVESFPSLLRGVLESLMDGILILTDRGRLVDANSDALRLCRHLMPNATVSSEIPQQIWHICEALIESRELFPGRSITIEDEIIVGKSDVIRIRARWIELDNSDRPHVLVMLEDRHQSLKNIAIAEARKYGLTSREAEVWLLRRANRTYKAIAAELHIAIDTVKKHLKSIHAKREAFLWANES